MTRVEAVARALYAAGRGEFGIRPDHPSERARRIFEKVWSAGGTTDDQRDDIKLCYLQAQAAIEAGDAWLKERGWKVVPKNRIGAMIRSAAKLGEHDPNTWYDLWDAAPTQEDMDK